MSSTRKSHATPCYEPLRPPLAGGDGGGRIAYAPCLLFHPYAILQAVLAPREAATATVGSYSQSAISTILSVAQPCIRRVDGQHFRVRLVLQARIMRKAIRVPHLHQVPVRLVYLRQGRRRVKV
jgi:hypothetical protein